MPSNQNELPSNSLPQDVQRGSPEKWLAVLAPILLTFAALALFTR